MEKAIGEAMRVAGANTRIGTALQNDTELAVAGSLLAVRAGASLVQVDHPYQSLTYTLSLPIPNPHAIPTNP